MAEIIVTSTADSGAGSLRQAIADAQDGDVILFDSAVFPTDETTVIFLSAQLSISKSVTIAAGEPDGNGDYTAGATVYRYVYRVIDGASVKVTLHDGENPLPGETVYFEVVCRVALNGQSSPRIMITGSSSRSGNCTIAGIAFIQGSSTSYGAGLYSNYASVNTLKRCAFSSCHSGVYGGGIFGNNTSSTTLIGCSFRLCTAEKSGGAIAAGSSTSILLFSSSIDDCTAVEHGSAVYLYGSNTSEFDCVAINGQTYFLNSATLEISDSDLAEFVGVSTTSNLIVSGVTSRIANATIGAINVAIGDGSALSLTSTATIGAATFASEGRGYLATASGIDLSAATLTNVVPCEYGAGLTAFDAEIDVNAASLTWTQTDSTKTILLEADSGSGFATLTQSAAGSYAFTATSPTTYKFLAFDGAQFYRKTVTRTYYYIGGTEGSFTSAADWSLTSGGAAISAAPTVKDCKFIIE